MANRVLRSPRAYIAFAHDIFMAAVSFVAALYLRLGEDFVYYADDLLVTGTITFTALAAVTFWAMRLYQGIWRYASLNDLFAITKAVTLVILGFVILMFALTRLEDLPRSLPFINWFVLMALIGGPRVAYRWFKDRRFEFKLEQSGHRRIPVLLIGAGDEAELFIRALSRDPEATYKVVGLVSVGEGRVGRNIQGYEVLDTLENLPSTIESLKKRGQKPQRLILTKDDLDGAVVRSTLETAEALGLTLARLPRLTELKSGHADKMEVRPIDVEDLLGRPQARLDRAAMSGLIKDRRVLVTGAGGSIGSELVRQISDFAPSHLTLLENGEFALYKIDHELSVRHPELPRTAVIADVRDKERLSRIFEEVRPELVFHAAALKHVPLVEDNMAEGILTNVVGTRNVADLCIEWNVQTMVQVSTDKAVNPTNVMGATKRIAEKYCQALDVREGAHEGTRFVTVRFGNVLGSTGSVVPLFQKQLEAGGPLTVTHPDMTRFFMTIREAVELILQASALRRHGHNEEGKIYVLDMGDPVKIVDLARQMIRLAGRTPDKDVMIEFTGIRPGEKLYEEIFHGAEPPVPTEADGILIASPRLADHDELADTIDALKIAAQSADEEALRALIADVVPEFGKAG